MSVARTVAEILAGHVTMEVESIDRLYLNLYVPLLQRPEGTAYFWRTHRGHQFVSSGLLAPMTRAFVASIERFVADQGLDLVQFRKGQRKEDIAKKYLAEFPHAEGVLFVGKAQEKVAVIRTEVRRNPTTGKRYPWLVKTTAMVNQYYFYCVDKDFGPFFIKLCSYFPYNGRVCLNGHEYLKRQLTKEGIPFEALDNGLLRCDDPQRAQRLADGLCAGRIEALVRKWLRLLPHPFPPQDRRAGFRYDISILQAEFSRTQVLDQPVTGRIFFEQIIRDNLDLGRPDRVQLVFGRRITRQTPGYFRTRVVTDGVIPSIYIEYKHTLLKQYLKEGRALRTETTINDPRDFELGKRLKNLSALRKVGFQANRRLLDVQRISHDCSLGDDVFRQLHHPLAVGTQRVPALRFGDDRVLALLGGLVLFRLLPNGFAHRHLRTHVSGILGKPITPGQMTYDLRRLRLHGLIVRRPHSHRYEVTALGFRAALFLSRSYNRLLRPGLASLPGPVEGSTAVDQAIRRVEHAIDRAWETQQIAA